MEIYIDFSGSLCTLKHVHEPVADLAELLHQNHFVVLVGLFEVVWVNNSRNVLDEPTGELSFGIQGLLISWQRLTHVLIDVSLVHPLDKAQLQWVLVCIVPCSCLFNLLSG